MLQRRPFLGVLALALCATTASAQSTVTYLGSPTSTTDGTYYVGPFDGTVQTAPGSAQGVTMFCIDVLNQVVTGQTWTGVTTNLGDPAATLASTRHSAASDPQAMTRYRTAAWLTTQFSLAGADQWAGIQHAIWNVWAPSEFAPTAWDAAAATAASSNFGGMSFAGFLVLTDVAAVGQAVGGAQEFIVPGIGGTGSVVPEPGTYVLLGTGLLALGGFARRRRTA